MLTVNGVGHSDVRYGDSLIAPSDYGGNVNVNSITGVVIDTIATGARKVRLCVANITGTPGALYIAFGADAAEAVANVNATPGSEAGMLLFLTPADGDEIIITIPSTLRNKGSLAAGTATYSAGVNELGINITQGL